MGKRKLREEIGRLANELRHSEGDVKYWRTKFFGLGMVFGVRGFSVLEVASGARKIRDELDNLRKPLNLTGLVLHMNGRAWDREQLQALTAVLREHDIEEPEQLRASLDAAAQSIRNVRPAQEASLRPPSVLPALASGPPATRETSEPETRSQGLSGGFDGNPLCFRGARTEVNR